MDSEGEDSEDQSNFTWLPGAREVTTVNKNEGISGNTMISLKESNDSDFGAVEENLGVPVADSKLKPTTSSQDAAPPLTCVDVLTETVKTGTMSSVPSPLSLSSNSNMLDEPKINSAVANISNVGQREKEMISHLPSVNVPERIIICFDLSEDQFYLSSKFNEVNNISTLNVIKQSIELFIHNKHMIDKRHQFSLVVVHQKAVWLQDFTNKPKDIISVLSELTETPPSDLFCLTSLFDVIKENVSLPIIEDPTTNLPSYVIRPIIIYSRCQCVPKFYDGQESFHALMSSKYFGFDYIVIHESLSPESYKSDEIAKAFSEMCTKPYSIRFHISRSATKVLDSMAKLLSHPLQRGNSYVLENEVIDKHITMDSNG